MSVHEVTPGSDITPCNTIDKQPSILSRFRNELDKFNNTGARMLDSIYHRTLKLREIAFLTCKHQDDAIFYATL